MSPFVGELVGTACLVFLGDGLMARVRLRAEDEPRPAESLVAIGWAGAAFTGCIVAAASSGAHLNPAVTLGLAAAGLFPGESVGSYLMAQAIGALVGAVLAWMAHLPAWSRHASPGMALSCFCAVPRVRAPLGNLLATVLASTVMVLAFVCLRNEIDPATEGPALPGPLSAWWSIGTAFIVLAIGTATGAGVACGLHPTRDLAGRVVHALLPLPGKEGSDWGAGWVAIAGPMLGALLAAWLFRACGGLDGT